MKLSLMLLINLYLIIVSLFLYNERFDRLMTDNNNKNYYYYIYY